MVKIVEEVVDMPVENNTFEKEEIYISVSRHPYILTEGQHYRYVAGNVILQQVGFYKFKLALREFLKDRKNKQYKRFFSTYGLLDGQRSCIEDAIQKGFQLNYVKMKEDLDKLANGNDRTLIGNIETLKQLSHIKLIESRLVTMFNDDIVQEQYCGELDIAQAIASATKFVYAMYGQGWAESTDIMMHLTEEDFFVERDGLILKREVELSKEEALKKYLQIPVDLINAMISIADFYDISSEKKDQIFDKIEESLSVMAKSNAVYAEQFKEMVEASNAEKESEQKDKKKDRKKEDDFSIMYK